MEASHSHRIQEDPWRVFKIMAKFVESFGPLSRLAPAVSRTVTLLRSSRSQPGDTNHKMTEAIAAGLARGDFLKRTDSTDEVLRIILDDRERVGMANSVPEAIR